MLNPKRLISQNLNEINISEGNLSVANIKNLINKEAPVILEIGANCGQTTIDFIENFPNALIHCFEPDPRAIRKFKATVNSKNVHLHEIAIGNVDGAIIFHQSAGGESIDPEGWDHSGSIRAPKAHLEMFPWVRFDTKIEVPVMRLDSWAKINNINNVDFIWADVQGAEEDLILGGIDTLMKTRFFYTEYYDNECYEGQLRLDQLYQLLNQYLILKKYDNDVLLENFFANNTLPEEMLVNFANSAIESGTFDEYCTGFGADPQLIEFHLKS
jgi:FkbM family methyltransferase